MKLHQDKIDVKISNYKKGQFLEILFLESNTSFMFHSPNKLKIHPTRHKNTLLSFPYNFQ